MEHTACGRFPEISHLHLRAVQAPIAAHLIREFAGVLGFEKALEIATAAIRADALAAGKRAAEKCGSNSLKAMTRLVRDVWSKDGVLRVEFLAESERRLYFDVTRCGYAEIYRDMGLLDLGVCLSCSRDEPFAQGFNPGIRFARSQTIMQGAPRCDFRLELGLPAR